MMALAEEYADVTVSPVRMEIIRTMLQSIPDLIEADITRTAYSPLIYEYKDYAVGLVDAKGRSISLATHGLPLFLTNQIGLAVQDGLKVYGEDGIEPGDVIVSNHAATLGQHLNNVVMYTPVFGPSTRLVGFMSVIVHWIDIGGRYPGSSMGNDMTELAQEGLQLRSVKLYKRGDPLEELLRVIEYNSRQPEMLLGDIAAQHAGCVKGRELFAQLVKRHGEETVLSAIGSIWKKSEAAAREAVRAVPDGTYAASSFLDDDGVDVGKTIPVNIKVHKSGGDFTVDYTDIGSQMRGPFNSGFHGGGEVAARIAFKYLFSPHDPANEGSFAPVKLILPEGKFLSARPNAPMGRFSTPLPTVIDTIIAAMAPVMPDRVAAGHHAAMGVHGFSGINPKTQRFFSCTDTANGGWGASQHGDGVGPYKTMLHADNKSVPVESVEALYPVRVESMAWREDSAGPGRHRGGLGVDKTYLLLAPCNAFIGFERYACAPWGLYGGDPGKAGFVELESLSGERRSLVKGSGISMAPGERMHAHSASGGGFGPALERDPARVLADVRDGFVSVKSARQDYGVVIAEAQTVDETATRQLRAQMT
ncbi:MAG: hydantoinase B/oxoprolinase family protein [Betaproteobacteria bacterium]|nr:hydantoinase B/oxoprolinase family protein [Betaproteobacteria bacterium]